MKQKDIVKSSFLSRLTRAALILVFIGAFLTVTRGVVRLLTSGDRVQSAKERLEEARLRQEELKTQLGEVTSEYYREKAARDQLGLARPGEIIIVLPEEELLRRLSPRVVEEEALEPPKANWQKWAELFFKI